jgi:D-alanyl-D-alanine carboxypeptidase
MTRALRCLELWTVVVVAATAMAGAPRGWSGAVDEVLASAPTATVPEVSPPLAAAFRRAIDAWAAVPGHRGVTASVVLPDGAQWTGAAGLAGAGEPMRPDHLIGIASITKTMTGAVVLQLVDEGVVRLDDPIDRWLDPIANVAGSITVRQLLNHTSGLANYTLNPALGAAIEAEPARPFPVEELLALVGPPSFAAGERTEYTNTSFLLLGRIAERATGRGIVDLFHQRLWGPRGLTGVFLPFVDEPTGAVAAALGRNGVVAPLDQAALLSIGHSAFGLYADAATVARWGQALFTGDVLSVERQAEMRELVPAAGNIPGESGAGLGIRGYAYFDRVQYGHSGGMALGSSLLLFDPESAVTVVVLMNQGQNAGHFVLAPELLRLALRNP